MGEDRRKLRSECFDRYVDHHDTGATPSPRFETHAVFGRGCDFLRRMRTRIDIEGKEPASFQELLDSNRVRKMRIIVRG